MSASIIMKEASLPKICRVDNNPQAEITRVTNAVLLVAARELCN